MGDTFPHDVRGWLTEREGAALARLAAGRRVLEIGSYCGRSTVCLARTAAAVTAIDPFTGESTPNPGDTFPEFAANLERYGVAGKVTAYRTRFEDWTPAGLFDLVHLDAQHDYLSVVNQLDRLRPLLAPHGVVALHDYANADFPGVRRAADLLFARPADEVADSLGVFAGGMPGRTLHVVTPCTRPVNLAAIAGSLPTEWAVVWHVLPDPRREYPVGSALRNRALDAIADGWVWFLDDDTVARPDFGAALWEARVEHPDAHGFVFGQLDADGTTRRFCADPWAGLGDVDTAQFVFARAFVGAHRWHPTRYDADGDFYLRTIAGRREAVRWIDRPVTTYNALRG